MEFLITNDSDSRPIETAVCKKYTRTEMRTCRTEEEFDGKFGKREGLWRSKGINHRIYQGGIARDHPDDAEGWFVDVNTIEDLMHIVHALGAVEVSDWYGYPPTIYAGSRM